MGKRIAIIGGGPGGLSAAIKAAESGLKVHLFEKGMIGSGIKCAEGFIDTLGVLKKPAAGVLFKAGRVNFFDGRSHYVNLPENLGLWMIDRATWQKSLAKRAAYHGGGMDMACLSGHMATELIASNQVDRYPQRLWHMVKKKFIMERRIGQLWRLFGYPLISCVLKSPELVRKIVFNKPPLPQLIGLIPSGRILTSRCRPSVK